MQAPGALAANRQRTLVHRLVGALYWLAVALDYTRPGKHRDNPVADTTLATPQRKKRARLFFSPDRPLIMSVSSFFASRITELAQ